MCLDVTITPLPKDVIKDAVVLVDNQSDKLWNGKELYKLLGDKGVLDVEFTGILFEEFSMRLGDNTHKAALKLIEEKKLAEKYGHEWRKVVEPQQRIEGQKQKDERRLLELEERKRTNWRCPN